MINLLILILIYGMVTLGLDLVVGYGKVFSVSQALMFAIGAFTFAGMSKDFHTADLIVAMVIGACIAALLGGIVAFVSLRVKGDYFIVISFGTQLIGMEVIFNWGGLSGGASGVFDLPFPSVLGWTPTTTLDYLILVVVVCGLAYAFMSGILVSPYGLLLRALGQDEEALEAAGFSALRLKVTSFMLGGAIAAIAGVLYAGYNGIAQTSDYSTITSILLLAMVIIGGAGRIIGGLIGAVLFNVIPYVLNNVAISSAVSGPLNQAILGVLLLLVVLFAPLGVTGSVAKGVERWQSGHLGIRLMHPNVGRRRRSQVGYIEGDRALCDSKEEIA